MKTVVHCKVCYQMVDLDSEMMSPASRRLEIHQDPCLHIVKILIRYTDENRYLNELLDYASIKYMFKHELGLPYFQWCLALAIELRKQEDILKLLTEKYKDIAP